MVWVPERRSWRLARLMRFYREQHKLSHEHAISSMRRHAELDVSGGRKSGFGWRRRRSRKLRRLFAREPQRLSGSEHSSLRQRTWAEREGLAVHWQQPWGE